MRGTFTSEAGNTAMGDNDSDSLVGEPTVAAGAGVESVGGEEGDVESDKRLQKGGRVVMKGAKGGIGPSGGVGPSKSTRSTTPHDAGASDDSDEKDDASDDSASDRSSDEDADGGSSKDSAAGGAGRSSAKSAANATATAGKRKKKKKGRG